MQCFNPITLKETHVSVPCGRCLACRTNYRNQWIFRLKQELKASLRACFVTLTYSDTNLPRGDLCTDDGEIYETIPVVMPEHLTLFFKRLRKSIKKKYNSNFKYFAVGEYGDKTMRPHYHVAFFGYTMSEMQFEISIQEAWTYGHIHKRKDTPRAGQPHLRDLEKGMLRI